MTLPNDPRRAARALWTLIEPLHAVVYFTEDPHEDFAEVGLRGGWRRYFAGRAAPLGPVGAAPVTALFFGFAPAMVARALPGVWELASPQQALDARRRGARRALARLLGPDAPGLARAAELTRRAAQAARTDGRALAAANAALPWPQDDPLEVLWHAVTVLREHRGDGHVAALTTAGLNGCESIVWRAAYDNDRAVLQPMRGWTGEDWDRAAARLAARGWLDADGRATEAGRARIERVEESTDDLAAEPWAALSADEVQEAADLLRPLAVAAAAELPYPNPVSRERPLAA